MSTQTTTEATPSVDFLNQNQTTQTAPCKPRRRRTVGVFGTTAKTINSGLTSVGDSAEVVARTVGLANLQLKATYLEIQEDIYADLMERGYSRDQAKEMLDEV